MNRGHKYHDKIANLKKAHAEKLLELERESELAALLPAGFDNPYMIHRAASDDPLISYKVQTLAEALAIVRAYPAPMDVSARESGSLSIQPVGFHRPEYMREGITPRWIVDQCICIRQHSGRGFYVAEVEFWCVAAGRERLRVQAAVAGFPWKLRASMSVNYNRRGEILSAQFRDSELRNMAPAARVKFDSGSPDAFDIQYYFAGVEAFAAVVAASSEQ